MDEFKDQVKRGFQNCRLDIEDVREENSELKNNIGKLNSEISELKAELKGVSIALNFIKEFKAKQEVIPQIVEEPKIEIKEEIIPKQIKEVVAKTDPYEALLAFKAKANKREVLKQKMTSFVTQSGINLSELKFLFVDHYKYCSKATFYNYLKELELERHIKIERENSKNFVFLYNHNQLEKEV
ncbi:MAG: hypothetical protein PF569_02610 [Candidatus Woesearchaeota archaeon]|jgi:hypothetical protein|nr:hypothetical protein [Candidatus Woesearchaeota archaeon]